ncbi:MAG: sulfatase [Acidobacteriota bacterium]
MRHLVAFAAVAGIAVQTIAALPPAPPATPKPPPALPNFVLIVLDDLGYGDLPGFDPRCRNKTPTFDRMARDGMKLTSFYAAPVCSPSRAQALTGCYAKRVSIISALHRSVAIGLNPDEVTIAEILKSRGYATLCVGKWHLGDQPPFLPTAQGFDHYFGPLYSNDMLGAKEEAEPLLLLRDDLPVEAVDLAGQARLTERYTEEAVKFIKAERDRPFLLYLPHTAVHTPLHPGPRFAGKSGLGPLADWVREVDASTGRILAALDEIGAADRTLVFVTSDNGPWLKKGESSGSPGPLRGGKNTNWEGGVRVPAIAFWPGRIPAGTVVDAPLSNVDLLPTIAGLAGGKLPQRVIDGKDIGPVLLGSTKESPHEAIYFFRGTRLEAVRSGPWKLFVDPAAGGDEFGPDPVHRKPRVLGNPVLFNLVDDIGERKDVAAKNPEVVARMKKLIAAMDEDLGVDSQGPGVRLAGRVEEPRLLTLGKR